MKKAMSILLTLVLLFSLVSGCGTEETTTTSTLSTVKLTLPCSTGTRAIVEGEAVIATQLYLLTRAYCEKLGTYDTDSFDAQDYAQLVSQAAEAFRITEAFCGSLECHADDLAQIEEQGAAQQEQATYELLSASNSRVRPALFATTAYAAEAKSPAVKYAEEITQAFDTAKNGQKLKSLAQQYGTDVKHAKAMLEQAQAVLAGAAYEDQAAFENQCYEAAVETKAAASLLGFGVAVAATGGLAAGGVSAAGIVEAGGLVCSGLQAVIDTGSAASIHVTNGEGNDYTAFFEKADEALSGVSTFFAIGGGVQNIVDFRNPEKAAEKVNNAAQAFLAGVGLVRDYVQDDKVLGISSNIYEGYREILLHSADCSDPEAAKQVLTETGISPEVLENTEVSSKEQEQTGALGAAADTYLAAFEGLLDPANPVDIDTFLNAVDAAFTECAQSEGSTPKTETVPAAELEPSLNAETDPEATASGSDPVEPGTLADPEAADEPEAEAATPPAQEEPGIAENPVPAAGGTLSAYDVAGAYYFAGLDGSENMTIVAEDDTHLTVTDVNYGESIYGEYDETTGVFTAELSDSFSWYVTISFTDTGDGVQADYENSIGGNVTSASSAMKEDLAGDSHVLPISDLAGTYAFQGSDDVWTQIVTVADDTHLMFTDADDPEAVIIGYYDEATGIFSYSETGNMGDVEVTSSATVTFTDTGSGIKADMVLAMITAEGSQQAVSSAMKQ